MYNPLVVKVVTSTALAGKLETRETRLSDNRSLIEKIWRGESLFFTVNDYGLDNYLYYTPDFDFRSLFEGLWEIYEGKILISRSLTGVELATFPEMTSPIYGSYEGKVNAFCEKHKLYQRKREPRTYLLLGPPGCGKSKAILTAANRLSTRVMRVESESVLSLGFEELSFVLRSLVPEFLIIEDIDKISFDRGLASFLSTLEWLRTACPTVTVAFTVNDIHLLHPALRRPERIDEYWLVDLPNLRDRKAILQGYLTAKGISLPRNCNLALMGRETKEFSPVWLRELVRQCEYMPVPKALETVRTSFSIATTGEMPRKGKAKKKTTAKAAPTNGKARAEMSPEEAGTEKNQSL
jgi:hypothetical protein